MKTVIGEKYKTSLGVFIVLDSLEEMLHIGDEIVFEGEKKIVRGIQAPTKPQGKWAIQV